MFSTTRSRVISLSAAAALALGIGALGMAPGTGAYFQANGNGSAKVDTAKLTLDLGDSHGSSHTFKLQYSNVAPGGTYKDTFTVANTGSIAANVSAQLGQGAVSGGHLTSTDELNQLSYSIEGFSDHWQGITDTNPVNLGTLQPGQTYTYTVDVQLSTTANDDWQGVELTAPVTATLNQTH